MWTRSRSPARRGRRIDHAIRRRHAEERVSLGLGGKSLTSSSPTPISRAVEGALFGVFFNQGRGLLRRRPHSRQRSIYKVPRRNGRRRSRLRSAPPLDRATKMGALVSREQYDRVRMYQELGKRKPRSRPAAAGGIKSSSAGSSSADDFLRRGQLHAHRARKSSDRSPASSFDDEVDALNRQRRSTASPPRSGRATSSAPCASSNFCAGIVWVNHAADRRGAVGGYKQEASAASSKWASRNISTSNRSTSIFLNSPSAGNENT